MPQFLVLTIEGDDVPPLGGIGHALAYRGDHATAAEAADVAADVLDLQSGRRLWAVPASQLVRYRNTTTVDRTAAPE